MILASIAAIAAGAWWGWRQWSVNSSEPLPDLREFPVRGVDLSAHNGDIDFNALASDSLRFVIIKATEGKSFKDKNFNHNYVEARRAGLKVGAYHFFRFESPGDIQAINLLHSLRGKVIDLPVVIDVEEWTNPDNELPANVARRVREMADYLLERDIPVMVYSNREGYDKFLSREFGDCSLWICSLRESHPEHNWDFWQFTHRSKARGVEGKVDMNVFNGSTDAWETATAKWRKVVD